MGPSGVGHGGWLVAVPLGGGSGVEGHRAGDAGSLADQVAEGPLEMAHTGSEADQNAVDGKGAASRKRLRNRAGTVRLDEAWEKPAGVPMEEGEGGETLQTCVSEHSSRPPTLRIVEPLLRERRSHWS